MTPDVGQGGCCALEDSVVLARCLGEALLKNSGGERKDKEGEEGKEEYERIEMGLNKYANERRWRSIDLISTSRVGQIFISNPAGETRFELETSFNVEKRNAIRLRVNWCKMACTDETNKQYYNFVVLKDSC
ncbi:unnamed protein product [Prunus armeniaca]